MTTTYSFTTLDYKLNSDVATSTYAYGINDAGQVVGTYYGNPTSSPTERIHGFTYYNGIYT